MACLQAVMPDTRLIIYILIDTYYIQSAPDAPLYVEVSQPPQLLGNYPMLSPDYVSTF